MRRANDRAVLGVADGERASLRHERARYGSLGSGEGGGCGREGDGELQVT